MTAVATLIRWAQLPNPHAASNTIHTTLFAIKGSNNKKTNKTKKKKQNKPLQDKSNTTGQHNSILGLIFSTQSTNNIIGYGELAQKIRFSITYAHRRRRKIKHFHEAGRNFFGSSIEYFHECAYSCEANKYQCNWTDIETTGLVKYSCFRHPCIGINNTWHA